jgi:hypothetical protein
MSRIDILPEKYKHPKEFQQTGVAPLGIERREGSLVKPARKRERNNDTSLETIHTQDLPKKEKPKPAKLK